MNTRRVLIIVSIVEVPIAGALAWSAVIPQHPGMDFLLIVHFIPAAIVSFAAFLRWGHDMWPQFGSNEHIKEIAFSSGVLLFVYILQVVTMTIAITWALRVIDAIRASVQRQRQLKR